MSNHQSPRWSARITVIGLCALLGAGLLALGGGSSAADAAGATTQPSPYADKIGVITRGFWYSVEDGRAVYDRLVASGVTITREDFSWAHTEPTRGRFDWSRGDNMFTAASRSGIDILPILGYAAPWAALDPGNNQSMPSDIGAYANFSAAVVARYGPGGTFWAQHPELSPRPARTVEVFNEPWGYWGWPGNPDPAYYARMARAATLAIKDANPDVGVLISGDLQQSRRDTQIPDWIGAVLDAEPGLGSIIDGYSVHAYHYGAPDEDHADNRWYFGKIEMIRRVTAAHDANKPLWITEIGYSTARNVEGAVSEATQARYVRMAITRAFAEWPYVRRFFYYSYERDSGNPDDNAGGMALLRPDGSAKPAWTTITRMLAPRTVTTSTTAPPVTTTTAPPTTAPPTTAPPTTSTTQPRRPVVLGPARLAVRVLGRVFYYDPAPT